MEYKKYRELRWNKILELIKDENRRYDYVCGLRGPDYDSGFFDIMKICFTGFLRGKGETVDVRLWESCFDDIGDTVRSLEEVSLGGTYHWREHILAGLEAVGELGGDVKKIADCLIDILGLLYSDVENVWDKIYEKFEEIRDLIGENILFEV